MEPEGFDLEQEREGKVNFGIVERKRNQMIRASKEGYVRIGRYDKAGRRSTWVRLNTFEKEPREGLMFLDSEFSSIEICSGREGDDAYVKIESSNPAFYELLSVLEYSVGNVPEDEYK